MPSGPGCRGAAKFASSHPVHCITKVINTSRGRVRRWCRLFGLFRIATEDIRLGSCLMRSLAARSHMRVMCRSWARFDGEPPQSTIPLGGQSSRPTCPVDGRNSLSWHGCTSARHLRDSRTQGHRVASECRASSLAGMNHVTEASHILAVPALRFNHD